MKKIVTILCLALMAVSVNAQKLQVFKDGKLMAEFYEKDGWEFVFGESSTPSSSSDGYVNGHEYVEIGGVKWATMNVGATTIAGSYETCYGDYFQWGETSPRYYGLYFESKDSVSLFWKEKYPDGYIYSWVIDYEDAATVNWGESWRTPTKADFDALFQACGAVLYQILPERPKEKITKGGVYLLKEEQEVEPEYTGVAGILFVDATNPNKRIFFPECGHLSGNKTEQQLGYETNYWTSTKAVADRYYAPRIGGITDESATSPYYMGRPIRPIVK